MKVLAVLDSLAPGGTETSTVALAIGLRQRGVDMEIVTLKSATPSLADEARAGGLVVTEIHGRRPIRRAWAVRRLIRRRRPAVVHTALFMADQVGRLAALGTGVAVVSSLVNTPYDPARLGDPNVSRWRVRTLRVVDAITARIGCTALHAVSAGVATANAAALRYPADRIVVAERGRNLDLLGERSATRRAAVRHELGLADATQVVLSVGRLDHQKDHRSLLEAVTLVLAGRPDLVVLLAGKDGSASAEIAAWLADHPAVAPHVRVLGHRRDVGDLMAAADVLVVSSRYEGTAGVTIEAKAIGCPVVSTDLVGVRGILSDDVDAVLCPVGSPPAMAAAIDRILGDPQLAARLTQAGRADAQRRFTLEVAAARLEALYRSIS